RKGMSKLRKYSKEFKEEAVKLVRNKGIINIYNTL
ncbi:hypothetical protein NF27_IV00010, partial [Candidatus Jidaibacter acanthamoeba]